MTDETTPSVPEGWTHYLHKYGDFVAHNARKWFGDHYKEVSVTNPDALHGAAASIDQEVELRNQAAVNAAHSEADALAAAAEAARPDAERTDTPAEDAGPVRDVVAPIQEPVAPIVVPTVEEVRAAEVEAPSDSEVESATPAEAISA